MVPLGKVSHLPQLPSFLDVEGAAVVTMVRLVSARRVVSVFIVGCGLEEARACCCCANECLVRILE